jgi:GrpB-like predicted nucleotidyltransferase (UPF0157 family)
MVGLEKGTVRISPPNDKWAEIFQTEKVLLNQRIGHLVIDIQHVGSTSVPGLDAKPIIDIAIAISSVEVISQCRLPLAALSYIDRGDTKGNGGYLFVKESRPKFRTHHLHLVVISDPQWLDYLMFRKLLSSDKSLRDKYIELKRRLGKKFQDDRGSYTAEKTAFIRELLEKHRNIG